MTRRTRCGFHLRNLLFAAGALVLVAPGAATLAPSDALAFDFDQAFERVDPTFNYEGPNWVLFA